MCVVPNYYKHVCVFVCVCLKLLLRGWRQRGSAGRSPDLPRPPRRGGQREGGGLYTFLPPDCQSNGSGDHMTGEKQEVRSKQEEVGGGEKKLKKAPKFVFTQVVLNFFNFHGGFIFFLS